MALATYTRFLYGTNAGNTFTPTNGYFSDWQHAALGIGRNDSTKCILEFEITNVTQTIQTLGIQLGWCVDNNGNSVKNPILNLELYHSDDLNNIIGNSFGNILASKTRNPDKVTAEGPDPSSDTWTLMDVDIRAGGTYLLYCYLSETVKKDDNIVLWPGRAEFSGNTTIVASHIACYNDIIGSDDEFIELRYESGSSDSQLESSMYYPLPLIQQVYNTNNNFNYGANYGGCVGLLDVQYTMKLQKTGYYIDQEQAWTNKDNSNFIYTDLGPNVPTAPDWVKNNLSTHRQIACYLTDPTDVNNLDKVDPIWNKTITIIPNWLPITYQVNYNGNGFTSGSMNNSTHTYDVAQNLTKNAYKRAYKVTYNYNYTGSTNDSATATATFDGWATTSNGAIIYKNEASVKNLSSTQGAVINLYAKWTLGSVNLPTPTRPGYTFKGWGTSSTATNGLKGSYTPTSNTTLYAIWGKNVSIIKQPTSITVKVGETASVSVSAEGDELTYQWYFKNVGNTEFSKSSITTDTYQSPMDSSARIGRQVYCQIKDAYGNKVNSNTVTLNAEYDIIYKSNGGSGTMSNSTHNCRIAQKLSKNTFTRPDYKFLGWSTSNTATSPTYTDEQTVSGLTYTNSTVTLYAVWELEGLVNIYTGTTWEQFISYVFDGTKWIRVLPYIYNNNQWQLFGK